MSEKNSNFAEKFWIMVTNVIKRYVWLLNTIYSRAPITKEEIDTAWSRSAINESKSSQIPRETFNRYRDAIAEIFDVEILCDRRTNTYSVSQTGHAEETTRWLISTFSMANTIRESESLASRIALEEIPSGLDHLSVLVDAMHSQVEVMLTHQSFHRTEPHTFSMQPYGLKVFKRRWYVIGYSDEYQTIRSFALDRVLSVKMTNTSWTMPENFDLKQYFGAYAGIMRDEEPEVIRVWVSKKSANFVRTLPIHSSQQEIEQTADGSIFQYYVAPTIEFLQELRAHSFDLRVIQPESLRKRMQADAEKVIEMYKNQ